VISWEWFRSPLNVMVFPIPSRINSLYCYLYARTEPMKATNAFVV